MAAADKIYGNKAQYDELREWLKQVKPMWVKKYMAPDYEGLDPEEERLIAHFDYPRDAWLAQHCPINWVLKRISEQYGIKSSISMMCEYRMETIQ